MWTTRTLVVVPLATQERGIERAMRLELRDYQRAAVSSVYEWWSESTGNPLVVVPTGGGKSVIAAALIQEICEAWPEERILLVTHVRELIEQNLATLLRLWPEAPTGVYSAGLKRRDTRSRILFACVQSTYRRAEELGHFDIVIVDEAPRIPPKGFGMYQRLWAGLREMNPSIKMIGLTATPYRTDTGRLDEGEGRLFHGVCYDCDIVQMIEDGWLSPVTNQGVRAEIDTSDVHIRAGEFRADELEEAATVPGLVERSMEELIERARDRKSWLIFACGVSHAEQICSELDRRGVSNTAVFGHTPADDRDKRIAAFKRGDVTALVNVNVLTTGFDAPGVDLLALMRPTQSPGLYVQMVGRSLRTSPGKTDALILDFGGNVCRHGPLNKVRSVKAEGGAGEAMMKKCPTCLMLCFAATTICPECGHTFATALRKPSHDEVPDEHTHLILAAGTVQSWTVTATQYTRHKKLGKPDSMKATYTCASGAGWSREISEWICFEHDGYAGLSALRWWMSRKGKGPIPNEVTTALKRTEELSVVTSITVDVSGKYPEIKGVQLDEHDEPGWRADAEDHAKDGGVTAPDDGEVVPF